MNPEENEKIVWDRKLFWKVMKWVGVFLFSFYLILVLLSYFGPKIEDYLRKKSAENYFKKIEEEDKRLFEMQRNDTYGGNTPEETLNLYIEALKKGDIDLASKYSRVDQWERAKKDLSEAKNKDNLNFAIDFATSVRDKGVKKCSNDSCYIEYVFVTKSEQTIPLGDDGKTLTIPAGSNDRYSLVFKLNPDTKIWKMVRP